MKFKSAMVIAAAASIALPASSTSSSKNTDTKIPTITIHAMRYAFRPSAVTLKQGEPVRLIFITDDVPHGLSIADLGVDVNIEKKEAGTDRFNPERSRKFFGSMLLVLRRRT